MKYLKDKNIQKLTMIIITTIVIIGILFFYNDSSKFYLPNSINDEINSVEIKNDINSQISEVKYNTSLNEIANEANLYRIKVNSDDILSIPSQKLGMVITEDNGNTDLIGFKDETGNSIRYQKSSNLLYIENSNNVNLKGFNKDNILDRLSSIFNVDMSSYYLASQTESLDKTSDIFDFSYKIKSYKLVTDFNYQGLLKIYLAKDGSLRTMMWDYMNFDQVGTVKLLSLSYVKTNFASITKGIYPNFSIASNSSNNSSLDTYIEKNDFKGKIEINNIELSYLLSEDKTKVIIPIYRLSTKFYFDTGTITDGTIIIPASNTSSK